MKVNQKKRWPEIFPKILMSNLACQITGHLQQLSIPEFLENLHFKCSAAVPTSVTETCQIFHRSDIF